MAPASSAAIPEKAAGNASMRSGSLVFAWFGRHVRETSTSSGTEGTWADRVRSRERDASVTIHLGGETMAVPLD